MDSLNLTKRTYAIIIVVIIVIMCLGPGNLFFYVICGASIAYIYSNLYQNASSADLQSKYIVNNSNGPGFNTQTPPLQPMGNSSTNNEF